MTRPASGWAPPALPGVSDSHPPSRAPALRWLPNLAPVPWGTLVLLPLSCLLGAAWREWQGSFWTYAWMSLVFAAALAAALHQPRSVGLAILALVSWIGYWLKLALHLVEVQPAWFEPTGRFVGDRAGWDEVALVASAGGLGLLAAALILRCLPPQGIVAAGDVSRPAPAGRRLGVRVLIVATGCLVLVNEALGLFHAGLRPAVVLPWPWHGVLGWTVSVGLALPASAWLYQDLRAGRAPWPGLLLFLGVGAAVSISTCSRGTLAMQVMPLLAALFLYRRQFPGAGPRQLVLAGLLALVFVGLTVGASQQRRAATLPEAHLATDNPQSPEKSAWFALPRDFPAVLARLSVDRWIGLEGVMAVTAWPGKSSATLAHAAVQRRDLDHVDFYTAQVAGGTPVDTARRHFASPPGLFAFLHLSGSLAVVFAGSLVASLVLALGERAVMRLSCNPFLAAQVGGYGAMVVMQAGAGGLIQPATSLAFTLAVVCLPGLALRHWRAPARAAGSC